MTQPNCIVCGRFIGKDYDMAGPYGNSWSQEPPDPEFYCGRCKEKEFEKCMTLGVGMPNYWQKPRFQVKAMKALGIIERDARLIKQL